MPSFALVTKTYRGDLGPFRDLCDSIDRLMPDVQHYVLVDHADRDAFRAFANPRRTIVDCSTLLPQLQQVELLGRRFWRFGHLKLVRGWIFQQLAKIAFVASMDEEAAVHLDSDVTLLRAIATEDVFHQGKIRLLRTPLGGQSKQHRKWHRLAQQDLGLPVTGYQGFDYIGPGVIWSSAIAQAMLVRLDASAKKGWLDALAQHFRFSEYLHYGIFCDQVEGEHQELIHHYEDNSCHTCWGYNLRVAAEVDRFVADLMPDHRSVLVQSNLKLDEPLRQNILNRLQARFEALESEP